MPPEYTKEPQLVKPAALGLWKRAATVAGNPLTQVHELFDMTPESPALLYVKFALCCDLHEDLTWPSAPTLYADLRVVHVLLVRGNDECAGPRIALGLLHDVYS